MIRYIDSFGRETIIEVLPSFYNKRGSLVIRKERQSIYESLDIACLEALVGRIREVILQLEEVNVSE